jgi:hypothetical protein
VREAGSQGTSGAFGRGSAPCAKLEVSRLFSAHEAGSPAKRPQKTVLVEELLGNPDSRALGSGGGGEGAAKTGSPAAPAAPPRLLAALPPVGSIGARRL